MLLVILVACFTSIWATPIKDRIVGGLNATEGQFPFIISLRYGIHTCGGVLLTPEWVATAAHCIEGSIPFYYTVVAGITKLDEEGTSSPVILYVTHPNFEPETLQNDISLVRVSRPINETDLIKPARLGCQAEVSGNVVLAGWGTLRVMGDLSNQLQYLPLIIEQIPNCRRQISLIIDYMPISNNQICAFSKVGEGACHGDSGGPLISRDGGEDVIVGLVSWGLPCALGLPDVYTRISAYCQWIDDIFEANIGG